MTLSVAVVGATGRMGRLAIELIDSSADLHLHSKLDSQSALEKMLGADVVLDLTLPEVSPLVVEYAVSAGLKVVVGTSGWSKAAIDGLTNRVTALANGSAVIIVPNFSIGSTLAQQFARQAAKFYESIEIIEQHHAGKLDSPSGTAVRTAELIHEGRKGLTQPLIPGIEQPARGQVVAGVPIHSLRMHGVSASQETIFGGQDEQLVLRHVVTSTKAYQQGMYLALSNSQALKSVSVGLETLIKL